ADSTIFLAEALKRVRAAGYAIANVDSTLILAAPKIGPHAAAIRARVAELLGIPGECVGIKAKTPEGMGTDNAAIAHVAVLLEKKSGDDRRQKSAMEAIPQPEIDKVVDEVLRDVPTPAIDKARKPATKLKK